MFIQNCHLTSKSFAAVHETFSNAHPGKEVPNKGNKISEHVMRFCDKRSSGDKTGEAAATLISVSTLSATAGHGYRN
jgi:hypothetical protein